MLRVSSSNVLVVPPWECAWLSDEQLQLKDGAGCVCFDVKGAPQSATDFLVVYDAPSQRIAPQEKTTLPSYSKLAPARRGGSTMSGITKALLTWAICILTAITLSL